jgi:hypothetical protein
MMRTKLTLFLFLLATITWAQEQRAEYFLDTDPGYGLAQTISNLQVGENQLSFDLSQAPAGAHVLYVRTCDEEGRWSATISRPIFINRLQDIVRVEYFFDKSDPGIGLATSLPLPEQSYKAHLNWNSSLDISTLPLGEHTLSVRAMDAFGTWTDVMTRTFTIVEGHSQEPPAPEGDLQRLEYFIDIDPGYGLGNPLASPNTGRNVYEMSIQGVETGAHVLYLRAQDKLGSWSSTQSRPIYVCQVRGIAAIEYFFDGYDPGEGMANAVAVTDVKANAMSFDIDTNTLTEGDHTLSVRVKSIDGRWSLLSTEPFCITNGQNGISTITFTMPLRMSLTNHILTIEATDGSQKADCCVELFDVSGRRLSSAVWPATSQTFTLHVNATNTVVVKVTDLQTHKQTVKHILAR